ncbi:MAG: hypothetical protein P8L38_02495 [Gammaproteobacteria bacterium]|nr:hypothetical protein [Gammaproteobacteria bacterium]
MNSQKKILKELLRKDKKLGPILDNSKKCPFLQKPIIKEEILFYELAQSIVGQQISAKVADVIWNRLISETKNKKKFLIFISQSNLKWARKQGLSSRKHEYIKTIAKKIISKKLSLESVKSLNDADAKDFLSSLKGVGPWTSEMFLMFAYKRLDIFSIGDIALRRAVSEIYDVSKDDQKQIVSIADRWTPYRSIVCWYLWEHLGV